MSEPEFSLSKRGKQDGDTKSQTISIKISKVDHPNAPSSSEENLIEAEVNSKSLQGVVNPSFSIETASNESSTPRKSLTCFNFDEDVVQLYKKKRSESYTFESTHPQQVSLPRRGSYSPGKLSAERVNKLKVPKLSELRRPSDPALSYKDIKPLAQLTPITSTSIDNFSYNLKENSFPPPSPGFYGNGKGPYFDHPPLSPGLLSTNSAWSELAKLHSRRSSYGDFSEGRANSNSLSNVSSSLSQYLHDLVRAFSSRTERIKESTVQPPTPSSGSEVDAFSDVNSAFSGVDEPPQRQHRIDSFIPSHLKDNDEGPSEKELEQYYLSWGCCKTSLPNCCRNLKFPSILEPQSKIYMSWLALVTLCFMYNAWAIPLRAVFPYQTTDNLTYWLICDYVCDLVYILDIVMFKPRLTYLQSGVMETDTKLTRKNYMKKTIFKFDVLSLMPLDLLYFAVGRVDPLLRLPRVLKIQTFWEFYDRCDQAVRSAHILRIIKTMTYMLLLIHVETCLYYAISLYEGINSNRWVYNGKGNAYIRCFYLATKTATSIGNNPQPTNTLEYIFMTVYWLSGVFVFALLIGQIRDIADAAGRVKSLYNKRMDAAIWYVKNLNLPKETQDKVKTWFIYNWQQQKILDEKMLMNTLPKNLRTDLAIHVHFNTLSKVKMFQDCDKSLLFDLVLKLKAILYLPGDYVCRKGEVGKEMYIVSEGQVEVVGGPDNSLVLATLKEGSVFGEISLLALGGEGNRRTADVRGKGFVNLFILSKADFEAAMSEYPEAHKHMKKQAKRLLRQNAKLSKESNDSLGNSVEEIIKSTHSETPKMVRTVIQVLDPDSEIGKKLVHHPHDDNVKNESKFIKRPTLNQKKPTKAMPTEEEVEDFYDEMLTVEYTEGDIMDGEEEGDNIPLKQYNNAISPDHSDESADSGVQLVKAASPSNSTVKTISNKDSKDSIISMGVMDTVEETHSWVMKHALNPVEVGSKSTENMPENTVKDNLNRGDKDGKFCDENTVCNNRNIKNSQIIPQTFERSRSVLNNDSSDSDNNEELLMQPLNRADNFKINSVMNKTSPVKVNRMNGVPPQNQVTCSVEVHREKTLTPAPADKEKILTSVPKETGKANSSSVQVQRRKSSPLPLIEVNKGEVSYQPEVNEGNNLNQTSENSKKAENLTPTSKEDHKENNTIQKSTDSQNYDTSTANALEGQKDTKSSQMEPHLEKIDKSPTKIHIEKNSTQISIEFAKENSITSISATSVADRKEKNNMNAQKKQNDGLTLVQPSSNMLESSV